MSVPLEALCKAGVAGELMKMRGRRSHAVLRQQAVACLQCRDGRRRVSTDTEGGGGVTTNMSQQQSTHLEHNVDFLPKIVDIVFDDW